MNRETTIFMLTAAVIAVLTLSMCGTSPTPQPHWPDCPPRSTGNNATMFLDKAAHGLETGDLVGVFVDDVGCVGQALVGVGNVAVTIWGDDSVTPAKDGAAGGDSLRLRLHIDRAVMYSLRDTTGFSPNPVYAVDGLYRVEHIDTGSGMLAVIDSLQTALTNASNTADSLQAVAINATNRGDSLQTVADDQAATISTQQATISNQSATISTQSQKINDAVSVLTG